MLYFSDYYMITYDLKIIYDFFSKYNRAGVFNQSKLEMNMPKIFKTKYKLNFRKYGSRKQV